MKQLRRLRPSPAMVVACIALTVALGGTSVAAINALPKNSVGAKQLKKNAVTNPKIKANAVNGAKVANNSITGADVNEASLGTVPSATSATNATNATNATHASDADTVGGHGVSCAAGTVGLVGLCFETTLRAATTVFLASDTCKAAGGFLGDGATLRSG